MLTTVPLQHNRFAFKPERFLDDELTSAESSNLANPMDRDHWAFGAGYVHNVSYFAGHLRFPR